MDRITYLGSLASSREDIDSMLDGLREVTARWDGQAPLGETDRQRLRDLEGHLKQYLVARDPLRSFTLDSLEKRLRQQSQNSPMPADGAAESLAIILFVAFFSPLLSLLVSPYSFSFGSRLLVGIPLFFVTLHLGIAWFYFTSLKNFNQDLRRAFTYICAGTIVLSLGFSHYVLIELFGWQRYEFLHYGGITWLISLPFILMFLGLRIYAQLVGVTSRLMSPPVFLGSTLAVLALITVLPHASVPSEVSFDLWAMGAAIIPIFALLSARLTGKIRRNVTAAYVTSMVWLHRYLLLVGLGSISATIAFFSFGELYGNTLNIVIAVCGIAPQLLLLYTGYLFKRETGK